MLFTPLAPVIPLERVHPDIPYALERLREMDGIRDERQKETARKDENEKADQTVSSLFEVYNHPRQTICGDNVWRAFNAATEYLQYYGFRNDESMLLENLDGKAVQWKEAAFQLALEIAA